MTFWHFLSPSMVIIVSPQSNLTTNAVQDLKMNLFTFQSVESQSFPEYLYRIWVILRFMCQQYTYNIYPYPSLITLLIYEFCCNFYMESTTFSFQSSCFSFVLFPGEKWGKLLICNTCLHSCKHSLVISFSFNNDIPTTRERGMKSSSASFGFLISFPLTQVTINVWENFWSFLVKSLKTRKHIFDSENVQD